MRKFVDVVGVGALGSHLVQFLRGEDVEIKVVDDDRVESKNTMSQFHARTNIGKSKVSSLASSMNFLFGHRIVQIPHQLTDLNAKELLQGADLVIDCLDNAASRETVQRTVRQLGLPCLHGALAAEGALGRVVWDERFEVHPDDAPGAATCEDGRHLPFIVIVSGFLAHSAQTFLRTGKKTGFHVYPNGAMTI